METEVRMSYETLFDIANRERSKGEIQELPETFYADVLNYLKDKHNDLKATRDKHGYGEQVRKVENIIYNINRILKDIYQIRERKIIELALNKSRTQSNIIDSQNLLDQEKILFNGLLGALDNQRDGLLEATLNLRPIDVKQSQPIKEAPKPVSKTITVRFLATVPKFVSKDMKPFGPFQEDDIASLPPDVADILLKKQRAEQIEPKN